MRKEYEVAGHRFAVVMPDNEVAWNSMQSYKPFETEGTSECIFTAELIESMPDITEKKRITVSCAGSDQARIELYEYKDEWSEIYAKTNAVKDKLHDEMLRQAVSEKIILESRSALNGTKKLYVLPLPPQADAEEQALPF